MKSLLASGRRWWLMCLLGAMAAGLAGCGSVERDANHVSSRPWNSPKAWEGGMPTSLNEGR